MAESEKNGAPKDTEEREAEAYKDFLLEDSSTDLKETLLKVPSIPQEDLKDTRRLNVDEMRKIVHDKE